MSDTPRTDAEAKNEIGMSSIKQGWYVHADFARQLERELAAANERATDATAKFVHAHDALNAERKAREEAESTLASLADTIASAHRNTNMSDPSITDNTDLRELVWQLSYEANRQRQHAEAAEQGLAYIYTHEMNKFVKPLMTYAEWITALNAEIAKEGE